MLHKAAKELEDTEKMVQAAERLYGLYRWEQYDVLILPPSFPFGGMENPRLTFATPTILAGDKSLVGLIAHELAHSWSGNLVTNATWRDFWLNEGFTVYFERRIQEEVYGPERSEMEALIEKQEAGAGMKELPDKDEILYVDLKGRDPDEGFTRVPYVKGMLFLRRMEEVFGRERFDNFLRGYFNQFAFQSIVTGDFVDYLQRQPVQPESGSGGEDQRGRVAHAARLAKRYAAAQVRCACRKPKRRQSNGLWAKRTDRIAAGKGLDALRSGCTSYVRCLRSSITSGWRNWTAHFT